MTAKRKIGICEIDIFSRFGLELLLKCPTNAEILTTVTKDNDLQAHTLVIRYICTIVEQIWMKDVKIEKVTSNLRSSQRHI